jgi:cytochrome c-type biogenesis protein CcmH/NrfG
MNLTLQTASIATSLIAAVMLKAGSSHPASTVDTRRASEAWAASVNAEQSSDYAEALKQTTAWSQAGGDRYVTLLRTAWLKYKSQDYPNAAAYYAQASGLQPTALTPLLGLLATAQSMNDNARIQTSAERVLRVEPTNYKALMALAGAQFATAEYRKARSSYARVLGIYPEDNDAISGVSWSALYLGEKHEAQRGFERIASVSPSYPNVQDGLAWSQR